MRLQFLFLIAFIAIGVACDHPPISNPPPTLTVDSSRELFAPTTTTSNPSANSTPAPTATVQVRDVDESDCRAACHETDPNELLASGAKPLPANHADHKTCLNCHGTPNAPALPTTHTGRLDPSCRVCHKPQN